MPLHRSIADPGSALAEPDSAGEPFTARLLAHLAADDQATDLETRIRARLVATVGSALRGWSGGGLSETAELAGAAAEWAREGIELDRVLAVYHEAFRGVLTGDTAVPADRVELLMSLLQTVTTVTATAFVAEYRIVAREHQTAAQTLVAALLSGNGRPELARQAGTTIAAQYQVVALRIPAGPPDHRWPVPAEATARRVLRRVQAALPAVLGARTLSLLTSAGGTVLVPVEDSGVRALTDGFALNSYALERLSAAAGVPLTATVLSGAPDRIPQLAVGARELLELVAVLGRPPGLYRISDLSIEYQVTRPGPARDQLAQLLAPVRQDPRLLDTLREFLDSGMDRLETSRRLGVHPNSVSHRLRRIDTLTGLDLGDPDGITRARAALLVHRLEEPDS